MRGLGSRSAIRQIWARGLAAAMLLGATGATRAQAPPGTAAPSMSFAAQGWSAADRETFSRYLRHRARYYAMEQRWPRSLYWERRLAM